MIQSGGVYATCCQEEGILLQKHGDRNGRCIAILFKSIGVRGRFDSPDLWGIAQLSRDMLQYICACVKLSATGVSHHLGGVLTSLIRCRAIWGIEAIVSQYRAMCGQ